MISEALKKYIPSKDYVAYLESIDHSFTDFEEAAILCHVIGNVYELHKELKKIGQRTKDIRLKDQIIDHLWSEGEKIDHFRENKNGEFIYIVQTYSEEDEKEKVLAYTDSYAVAHEIGLRENNIFEITKMRLHREVPVENDQDDLYIYDTESENYEPDDHYDCEGTCSFYPDGVLTSCFSIWHCGNSTREHMMWPCTNKMFCEAYVDLPPMFEKGDFVRFAAKRNYVLRQDDDVLIGIVSTSRERNDEFRERFRNNKNIYVDYSDMAIPIQILDKDGDFIHGHFSPLELERAEPDKDAPWYELAQSGLRMVMGEGYIGYFSHCQLVYKDYLIWERMNNKTNT